MIDTPLQRHDVRFSLDGLVKVDVKYEEFPDCHLGKCVDNAIKFASHYENLIIVRGYMQDPDLGYLELLEHFWCWDTVYGDYFDTTPFCDLKDIPECGIKSVDDIRTAYYIEEELLPLYKG